MVVKTYVLFHAFILTLLFTYKGKIIKYGFWPTPMPFYPGYDAAGVVTSLASDYNGGLKVGDAVFTCNWGNGRHNDEEDPTNSLGI